MPADIPTVDRAIRDLADRLREVEVRLAALEGRPVAAAASGEGLRGETVPDAAEVADTHPLLLGPGLLGGVLSVCGRGFLVLGGAFLLRALVEEGAIAALPGVGFGLLYAVVWLAAGERAARRGLRLSAAAHGVTAMVIALPLVVEAAVRFAVVGPAAAVGLLAAITGGAGSIAWRHRQRSLHWAVVVGSLAAALALFIGAGAHLAATSFVLVLAVAAAVAGRRLGWTGPRWLVAAVADLLTMVSIQAVTDPGGGAELYADLMPGAVVGLAIGLAVAYLAPLAVSILLGDPRVDGFDLVQIPVALLIGVGGTALVVRATAFGGSIVGGLCVLLGALCYGSAFAVVDRRLGRDRTFFFVTGLGLALVLGGVLLPMSGSSAALVWGLIGLVLAALGGVHDRITLRAHAAVLLVAAALASSLPRAVRHAFGAGRGPTLEPWLAGGAGGVLALLVAGYAVLAVADRRRDSPWTARLPRLAILLAAVAGLGAALVTVLVVAWPEPGPGATVLAAVRSVILAGTAVALAAASRHTAARELGWLVYPLLAVTAARLLFADLRSGTAASLMVAFVACGAALLLAPRLLRRSAPASSPPAVPAE